MTSGIEAMKRAAARAPSEFDMGDFRAALALVAPRLLLHPTTLYHGLERLERLGLVAALPREAGRRKRWLRVRPAPAQRILDLEPAPARPTGWPAVELPGRAARPRSAGPAVEVFEPVRRGRVLAAVNRAVCFFDWTAEFTAFDVEERLREAAPELCRAMSGGAVVSALRNLERRRRVRLVGKRGRRHLWARR